MATTAMYKAAGPCVFDALVINGREVLVLNRLLVVNILASKWCEIRFHAVTTYIGPQMIPDVLYRWATRASAIDNELSIRYHELESRYIAP